MVGQHVFAKLDLTSGTTCLGITKHYSTSAQSPHRLIKRGDGGEMIWVRFATTGHGHLVVIESTVDSSVYQSILESNIRSSVQKINQTGVT